MSRHHSIIIKNSAPKSVTVNPQEYTVTKVSRRHSERQVRSELANLTAWRMVLDHYANQTARQINSPQALRHNLAERSITMTYLPGISLNDLMQNSATIGDELLSAAYRVGQLVAIKKAEMLAHGDFDPSHLLFDTVKKTLSVIDLEASHQSFSYDIDQEHSFFYGRALRAASQNRKRAVFKKYFRYGLASIKPQQSIWQDAVKLARERL